MQQMFLRLKEACWCVRLSQARASLQKMLQLIRSQIYTRHPSILVQVAYMCAPTCTYYQHRYNITRGKLQSHTCEVFNQQPREESAAFGTWRRLLLTCWKAPLHVHFCPPMTWMICVNGSGSFRDRPCWQERQFLVLMEMPSSTTTTESEAQVWGITSEGL